MERLEIEPEFTWKVNVKTVDANIFSGKFACMSVVIRIMSIEVIIQFPMQC